jgi:hypothetical protein
VPANPRREGRKPRPGARFLVDAIADAVHDWRAMRRVPQETLAAEMRELGHPWTGVTVSEVEHAKRNVTADELVGLAYLLNCTLADLCDPTGVASRNTAPIDIGTGTVEAAGISDWLHGRVRIRTDGPYSITYEAVPGHDKERENAPHLWDNAIRARSTRAKPAPARRNIDRTKTRRERRTEWSKGESEEQE